MLFGNVGVIEFKARDAQGVHIRHGLRGDAFEDALGQRLRVLEQAVDPRILVGVEGEGRGVNAAAAGRIGDHRAGRAVAGWAAFVEVEPFFERSDEGADACLAFLFLGGQRGQFVGEGGDQVFEFGNVVLPPFFGNRMVGGHHQTDRGDFTATATTAVTASRRVVVAAVEQQAFHLAACLNGVVEEAGRRVRHFAHETETVLQTAEQRAILFFGA